MTNHVHGAKEIEAILKRLPERVARNVTTNALKAGARVIANQARDNVVSNGSVDTGLLAKALRVDRNRNSTKGSAVVSVRVSTKLSMVVRKGRKKPTRARPSKYAHLVEFGTEHSPAQPFMRPALDQAGGEAIRKIGEMLGKGVEREAEKLAAGKTNFITGRRIR